MQDSTSVRYQLHLPHGQSFHNIGATHKATIHKELCTTGNCIRNLPKSVKRSPRVIELTTTVV